MQRLHTSTLSQVCDVTAPTAAYLVYSPNVTSENTKLFCVAVFELVVISDAQTYAPKQRKIDICFHLMAPLKNVKHQRL